MTDQSAEDAASYIARVRAEIEADAETLRRQDPELARRERELQRAWIDVAPPGAAGSQRELLLDRAERLATIDVDAPLGAKPGVRHVKGAILKGTYWYLRYVTDQINGLTNVLVRLLRRLDDRLGQVEDTLGLGETEALIDAPDEPSARVGAAVAAIESVDGQALVLSCGEGAVVAALDDADRAVVGVDADALRILPGVKDGLDLRAADPTGHLAAVADDSLALLVLAGFIEDLAPAAAWRVLIEAERVLVDGGLAVVIATDPADRDVVERDLRRGQGLAPATWAHLLARAGADVAEYPVDDPRHRLVIAGRFG